MRRGDGARLVDDHRNGRRKPVNIYGKTRAEVAEKLREAQHKRDHGLLINDQRMTVGTWLDHWVEVVLESRVANGTLQESTRNSYADTVRLHLHPSVGRHRLTKLTPAHVDGFIAAKRSQHHGKDGAKSYSANSLRIMRSTLRKALHDAEKVGLVNRNVVALSESVRPSRRAERYLTLDEGRELLIAIANDRLQALYVVALSLGLRRGEVLGLRWDDVDLDTGLIRIGRSLSRVRNRPLADGSNPTGRRTRLVLKDPKTESSRATLHLPQTAVGALRRHRIDQGRPNGLQQRHGRKTEWCSPLRPEPSSTRTTSPKMFAKVCEKAGLGHRNPHQVRHGAATILFGQGIPLHEVMDLLRHASISVTKDIYGHLVPERMRAGADAMDDALRGARPSAAS